MTVNAHNPEDNDLNTTAPDTIDDLSTTAPNPPDEPVWKMPEPVFRRTSGKLPKGYEREVGPPVADAQTLTAGENVEPDSPAIEAYGAPVQPVVKPKSSTLKLALVLGGLVAMVAFLIVFLTVVYFLFLR